MRDRLHRVGRRPTIAAMINMFDKLKEATGIFCPNESTTFGMLVALRQSKLAG